MTHQNHHTNGASLEDCHTNFFALTDLCGIKWRKFLIGERPNASGDPLDDPVLRSYSRCLECDILCVWRRVAAPKQDPDPNSTISYDIVTHPPLSLTAAKELWIFWYGEEPDLEGLIDPELLKNSDSPNNAQGAWESGLSYECRSLLFKALHNLIERCLLSKDIVRLGKWFVQPCATSDRLFGKSSQHLSFSFAFFVHGESMVCASIDLREHPAVRPLSPEYLAEAATVATAATGGGQQQQNNNSNNNNNSSSNNNNNNIANNTNTNSNTNNNSNNDIRLKPVILAPFGIAACLTGNSYRAIDPATEKLLEDWCSFYPLCNKDNLELPPIVEVITGGVKMRYPSKYVLVTDLDESEENNLLLSSLSTTSSSSSSSSSNTSSPKHSIKDTKSFSIISDSSLINNFGNIPNTHAPSTSATIIPERVWQDSITNPIANLSLNNCSSNTTFNNINSNNLNNQNNNEIENQSGGNFSTMNNNNNSNNNSESKATWDFVDPTQKANCTCTKCRKGGYRTSFGGSSSTSGSGGVNLIKQSGSSRLDKISSRFNRIPFHKRQSTTSINYCSNGGGLQKQQQQLSSGGLQSNAVVTVQNTTITINNNGGLLTSTDGSNAINNNPPSTTTSTSIEQIGDNCSTTFVDTLPNQRVTNNQGGASTYSRNSIGDSMPAVPSVGSPGSAIQSPHPNSTLSQPTSVPPSDNLISGMSPRPPASVPNMQQPSTPLDHLDKNTPAPTPTDQHDNKSITSPYIQPTPSVEPPSSMMDSSSSICQQQGGNNGGGSIGSNIGGSGIGSKKLDLTQMNGQIDQRNNSNCSSTNSNNSNNNNIGGNGGATNAMNTFISLLKRPLLITKDYENSMDDDCLVTQLLYDYSTWDAWMDHPVKRFKPNEDLKQPFHRKMRGRNLYDSHTHTQLPMPSPTSLAYGYSQTIDNHQIKRELGNNDGSIGGSIGSDITNNLDGGIQNDENINNGGGGGLLQSHEIKKEPVDVEIKDKSLTAGTGNLYTSEGLQVSYKDLDQIFDNSDDNSNDETIQVHTPPGSNKSNGCGIEDIKRPINCNNPNTSILRPEELSKMFPTPPSHEHHPNSSPCSGGIMDIPMTDITETLKIKQDIYPDLGSPVDEPIEDWSYVFIPPTFAKFVGSSKYAPLTDLPSQSLPPIIFPPNCVYKPSWQQPQRQQEQQQQQQQQHQQQHQHQQLQQQLQHQHQHQQQLHHPSNSIINNMGNSTNSIGNNPNNLGLSLIEREKLQQIQHHQQQQQMMLNQIPCPPPSTTPTMMQQMMVRAGMSPISPAGGGAVMSAGFPASAAGSPMSHHLNAMNRRTPIHPPPPYELAAAAAAATAVASPATSTSSYLNKQYNSQEPATPSSTTTRSPEANSLLVNVLLYDTSLNVFRDHNFDSCTLCVCTAGDGQKCVGNIRGSDSGIYVALPGTSFNPAISNGNNSNNMMSGGNSMRSISAFGGIDSPSCMGSGSMNSNQHQTGYIDEDPIKCHCGFSAVINRRLAYRSGLFYEDEMEITGMAQDPVIYKKKSLLSFLLRNNSNSKDSNCGNGENSGDIQLPQVIMDLLRDQCTIIQTSSSSIQRALQRYRRRSAISSGFSSILNILEFTDANDVICLAIEQGRIAYEISISMNMNSRGLEIEPYRPLKSNISVHKWPYVLAGGTRSNQDIVRMMKSMQPLLQYAFHTKCKTRMREATHTVKGPLTWRQFHRLAGRGTGQCEPQPIPSVIVGHEKDWLTVAPYAIHYWDKLLLEPYSYARDVAYLVVAPENEFVISKTKMYFKELSTTYEMCKLGRHTPIKGWDGILQVGSRTVNRLNDGLDEWFQSLGDSKLAEQIRMYASVFVNQIAPYLSRVPNDRSLLDPPESSNSNSNSSNISNKDRQLPSPMPPPSTPDPSQQSDRAPSTPKPDNEQDNQRDSLNSSATSNSPVTDSLSGTDDDINPPIIVIYVVEPFTCGSDSPEVQRLACLSLLKCYSELLSTIPELVRCNINFQIISLESILELGRNRSRLRFSDEMRCLALSVFSQCRRYLSHTSNVKSLTGFGTAANMEIFLKNKDEKNRAPYKMYTPPYILAPLHPKSEKTDTFRLKSMEQSYSVMYCNYCVSEDQSWLLATATDDRGELLETITINIDIPNRNRRRRAPARRLGLQKLMDFILGIISQTVQPWRLVVGRIGRIGHGELKSWSWLLSKQNLQRASKQLKEICKQCSLMYPHSVPSILSACLVTLEPDSKLRVMPDQFTPDERFSQISMQNPLSTPQDVTCTHILVFPTSAVSQRAFNELNETQAFENDDNLIFDFEDTEDIGDDALEIFQNWDPEVPLQQNSPEGQSNHGSPGRLEDTRSRQSPGPGGNNFNSGRSLHDAQDMEEVGSLLQQPLAVGYFVSTAPTGRMPSWFWASCPHLEDVCPVFLKTALHLHVTGIQQTTDDPLAQNHSSANDHPLDSSLTADVLRYVLEGYNVLSWLAMDSNTHDRLSCLPIHVQVLMQLYHMTAAMA